MKKFQSVSLQDLEMNSAPNGYSHKQFGTGIYSNLLTAVTYRWTSCSLSQDQ